MTGSRPLLEIAANSLDSALAAQAGGADRIELCAALEIGGLTPSHALITLVRERLSIPVYVLIRPRAGDFAYTGAEHATMLGDIAHCRAAGCDGVVIGALTPDGDVDIARCGALVAAAQGMGVTFHRAIDVCRDPARALEDIVALGCERVLSSGGMPSAIDGATALRALVGQAGERIVVMPGAGIDADNIATLRRVTGAREFHASAKRTLPSAMHHMPKLALGMEAGEKRSDQDQVRRLAEALHSPGTSP
jgi:copper homeostasis protein